ncbi:MAG: class I SAM-dependent methyltransferase [Gemmatimonadota bacterium]
MNAPNPQLPQGIRAEKEFMYRVVEREIGRVARYDTVVDLACGRMALAPSIPSHRYIGVDASPELVERGLRDNPRAVGICSRIEDLDPEVDGDLVLCLQCIGINQGFETANTLVCVDKLIDATRVHGRLIFNVGHYSLPYFVEIEQRLRDAFADVRIIRYGRFQERRSPRVAKALARAMLRFPVLARDEKGSPRRLYVAENRRMRGTDGSAGAVRETGAGPALHRHTRRRNRSSG